MIALTPFAAYFAPRYVNRPSWYASYAAWRAGVTYGIPAASFLLCRYVHICALDKNFFDRIFNYGETLVVQNLDDLMDTMVPAERVALG